MNNKSKLLLKSVAINSYIVENDLVDKKPHTVIIDKK